VLFAFVEDGKDNESILDFSGGNNLLNTHLVDRGVYKKTSRCIKHGSLRCATVQCYRLMLPFLQNVPMRPNSGPACAHNLNTQA
jgi:hypothetical protein